MSQPYNTDYSVQQFDQQYGQYDQQYNQQYGQHYGQQYGQQYGQHYGQHYGQQYGQQYNQQYDQQYGQQYGKYGPQAPVDFGNQGFNALCTFPYVQIKQKVESIEVISGYETSNKYAVLDPQGNLLMKCIEKSTMLAKLALGARRSMDIKISDASDNLVMNITRPFKLHHKTVTITDSSGKLIGTVLKKFGVGKTIFHVMNAQDQQLFTIRGGAFINVGTSRKFSISNSQGTEVGYIQKEWAGLLKEAYTDADNFSVHFPAGSDGEARALLIATTLFIDLSHFEK